MTPSDGGRVRLTSYEIFVEATKSKSVRLAWPVAVTGARSNVAIYLRAGSGTAITGPCRLGEALLLAAALLGAPDGEVRRVQAFAPQQCPQRTKLRTSLRGDHTRHLTGNREPAAGAGGGHPGSECGNGRTAKADGIGATLITFRQ